VSANENIADHYALGSRKERGLGAAIGVSVVVHAAAVAAIIAMSFYVPPKLDINSKPVTAHLVRIGEARNPKFLPRKDVTPPAPPKAFEVPTPVAAPRPRPRENRATSIFDKVNKPQSIFDHVTQQPSTAVFDKLEGDPNGNALGDASQAEGEQYYALLQAKIRQYFRIGGVPESELDKLRAILDLQLSSKGDLLHVEVAVSSGNATYDAEVVAAVKRAAPFGAPPEHLVKEVTSGVEVEFRYK
jgi:TonB family protein